MADQDIRLWLEVKTRGADEATKKLEKLRDSFQDLGRRQKELANVIGRYYSFAGEEKTVNKMKKQMAGLGLAKGQALKKLLPEERLPASMKSGKWTGRNIMDDLEKFRKESTSFYQYEQIKNYNKLADGHKKMTTKQVRDTNWNDLVQKKFLKAYRWNLSLVLITMNALRRLGADSRVLGAILMMLGKGMGYILDMVLLPLIPAIVGIMNAMIGVGNAIKSIPEPWRSILAGSVALVVSAAIGAAVFTGLMDLILLLADLKVKWEAVKAVKIVTTLVDGITGGLNAIASAFGFASFASMAVSIAAGLILGAVVVKLLLDHTEFFQKLDEAGRKFDEKLTGWQEKLLKTATVGPGMFGAALLGWLQGKDPFAEAGRVWEQTGQAWGVAPPGGGQWTRMQQGGTVPWSGLHYLHKGETVVPTGQGAAGRTFGTTVNINNPQFIVQRESDRALYESFKLMLDRELRRLNV